MGSIKCGQGQAADVPALQRPAVTRSSPSMWHVPGLGPAPIAAMACWWGRHRLHAIDAWTLCKTELRLTRLTATFLFAPTLPHLEF